jgi:hypothetical protein
MVADRVDHTRLSDIVTSSPGDPVAELSTFNALKPIDINGDGDLIAKDVTVATKVKRPDGSVVDRTLTVTMERANLKGPAGDREGRWIITDIKGK